MKHIYINSLHLHLPFDCYSWYLPVCKR